MNLRDDVILSQKNEGGQRPAVTDDDIHRALDAAARDGGSIGACRLLWGKLSRRGKRLYFKATVNVSGPLHVAVSNGHLEVVRLFITEFKWNINQRNGLGFTALCYGVCDQETARFLLENGANVNQGSALWDAVMANNTEAVRLLLMEYQACPNLNQSPAEEENANQQQHFFRNTCIAIHNGNAEILRMLLDCGAFVGHDIDARNGTSLNYLLSKQQTSLETKVAICLMLMEHANTDHATAELMKASFEFAIKQTAGNNNNEGCCQILLDAGMDPRMSMYCAVRAENLCVCQLLVREYQVDPFLQEDCKNENDDDDDDDDDDDGGDETSTAVSPFIAAARLSDTRIFEYFLDHWSERFASSAAGGGKNNDGDYPIHVVCCDSHVSLQAIQVLVNRQADALAVVDGEQGLLPFHFAANWGASLDVVFYLLQHCPDALGHGGFAGATDVRLCLASFPAVGTSGTTATVGMVETSSNDNEQQRNARGPAKKRTKTRHSGY